MKIVQTILAQMTGLSAHRKKFIVTLLATILVGIGKVNFYNLSRYSQWSEKTYRRQFQVKFEFITFNEHLIEQASRVGASRILVTDCSFIKKSGKKTYGKDYFFNGCNGRTEKGLEISTLAVVDVQTLTGYTLSVAQTPALSTSQKLDTSEDKSQKNQKSSSKAKHNQHRETTRIDFYLSQIQQAKSHIAPDIRYIVGDGNYSKEKFVTGVRNLNFHYIGKLRIDANMRYLYQGEQKLRGARRKYQGKVNLENLSALTFVTEVEQKVYLYTAVVNHVTLKRNIRLVYLVDHSSPKHPTSALLFSTDIELDALLIYQNYKARFQIEFIFRDAKQFTGLMDCQARDRDKLDFHFNASLSALNVAKFEVQQQQIQGEPFVFSLASYKRLAFNRHLLDRFISLLDLDPTVIKIHPNYQKLLSYGAIAA